MKNIIITVCLMIFSVNITAQEVNFNPYNQSLNEFALSYLADNENFDKIYILENEITSSLMKTIDYKNKTVSVIVVNNKQILKERIKSVLKILPLQATNQGMTIDVIHFGVEIKRRKLNLINSLSGNSYKLEYNCSTSNYSVKKLTE